MVLRIDWDKYEVALLIDACEQVLNNKKKKKDIVKSLSASLRKRAKDRGMLIDNLYRNENGMDLQMTKMEYILTKGKKGLPGASKLYIEIAELRIKSPNEYNKLLVSAKEQIGEKEVPIVVNNKEHFREWLENRKIEKYHPENIIKAMEDASEYIVTHNLSKASLFEIYEPSKFMSIANKLVGIKEYRYAHRNTINILEKAIPQYKEYLKESKDSKLQQELSQNGSKENAYNEDVIIFDVKDIAHSKDDDEEAMKKKLGIVTQILKQRYRKSPATSLTEILSDNKDIPVGYINAWTRKLNNITASQHLIAEGIICKPKVIEKSEQEKKEERRNKLEIYTEILLSRYKDKPVVSLRELTKQNPEVSFSYLNSWAREFFGLTAGEYLKEKGILVKTAEKSEKDKLDEALVQIRSYLEGRKLKNLNELNECGIGVTTLTLSNWIRHQTGKSVAEYLSDEGILRSDSYEQDKIYQQLYSISKVYDDPTGISVGRLSEMLGNGTKGDLIRKILSDVPWANKIADDVFSFSKQKGNTIQRNQCEIHEDFDKEKFENILLQRYRNGMQCDSIDFENFRDEYELLYGESINFDDVSLEERLRRCGIVYKDRIFPAKGIMDDETKEKLFAYIKSRFKSGKKALYYKAIMEDLSDMFCLCYTLCDGEMLKEYIRYSSHPGEYYFFSNYMTEERHVVIDNHAEVGEFLLNSGKPMIIDDICAGLSHIPKEQVSRIVVSDTSFLRNARGEFFHLDIFEISKEEQERIAEIINRFISENEYAIWTDVWSEIQEKIPSLIENNLYLSGLGIRNALSKQLGDCYCFNGPVISLFENNYAMRDVYQLYAKHHDTFSADDIYELSKEMETIIYFDALAEVSVRVNHDLFVSKDKINFDVDLVDGAIGSFISDDYIRIREIDSFLAFPNVNFEWNEYLLESFVTSYSRKYVLLNNGYALNNVSGVIAKKKCRIKVFVDACAEELAISEVKLNNSDALDYLVDVNMITRRRYSELDTAIRKANQIRIGKG